ncbi:hypothetical protein Tco_1508757 [Tanacetum coccineum]
MLAPSGGSLILYQAYGNLYAMTGRKAHLLEYKLIPSVGVFDEVFSTWMAFGGNTRDLGSFGEETNKITDLHQKPSSIVFTEHGDDVTGIKRRRRNLSSNCVRDLVTLVASRRGCSPTCKDGFIESSTWRLGVRTTKRQSHRTLSAIMPINLVKPF